MSRADRPTKRRHGRVSTDPKLTHDRSAEIVTAVADRPVHFEHSLTTAKRIARTAVVGPGVGAATIMLWFYTSSAGALAVCVLVLSLMWVLSDDDRTNRARALIYPADGPVGGAARQTSLPAATRPQRWRAFRG
jgi:hypothetical protein